MARRGGDQRVLHCTPITGPAPVASRVPAPPDLSVPVLTQPSPAGPGADGADSLTRAEGARSGGEHTPDPSTSVTGRVAAECGALRDPVVATSAGGAFITLDGTGANAYLGTMDRSRILRYNFASSTLSRFHDSLVGSGSAINSSSNLELDTTGATPVIYSGTQFPAAGVVKVDLATGVRSTVVMSDLAGPPTFATPTTLRIDRRPGAAANSMLLMDEGFIPPRLFSVDLAANTYDILFGTLFGGGGDIDRGWLLDAQLNRFVRGNFDGAAYELSALDVDTGIRATISGTGWGTGESGIVEKSTAVRLRSSASVRSTSMSGVRQIVDAWGGARRNE